VLPIVTPAPVVVSHGDAFRDLFDNQREFRHFQNYLTGLMILENKSMANISNCIVNSADKTNLSRFFSEAPALITASATGAISNEYLIYQRPCYSDAWVVLPDETVHSRWPIP